MRNFQDTFKTRKRSFISAFSIYVTVPLKQLFWLIKLHNSCYSIRNHYSFRTFSKFSVSQVRIRWWEIAIKVTYKRITFLIEIHTLLVVGTTSNNQPGEWVFWLYKSSKVVNIVLCFQGIQNMIHDEAPL